MEHYFKTSRLAEMITYTPGYGLSEQAHELIESMTSYKAMTLENDFYFENRFLPQSFQELNYKDKVISVNKEIEALRREYKFDRNQDYDTQNPDGCFDTDETVFLIDNCARMLQKEELLQYQQFKLSEEQSKYKYSVYRAYRRYQLELPKIELITDYLGLVKFFDLLLQDCEDLKDNKQITPPSDKYRFNLNLSIQQLIQIFTKLVNENTFKGNVTRESFLDAFGFGEPEPERPIIKWHNDGLAVYFIHLLIEKKHLPDTKWAAKCKNVFGINNPSVTKNSYALDGKPFDKKPKGYDVIDAILSKV